MQHALDAKEAARVSSHIDTCEACRAIVVAAVRGESQTPPQQFPGGTPSVPLVARVEKSLVGTRMGRYEIRSLLGAGGMGQVFAAYDAELDRSIALKVLRPELARAASVLADRLVRESRLMAKIAHPSVITVYDIGREGDAVFIAMEMIRGETLGALIARAKPGWREIATIFERAGQGLAAAHDAGIVHRDFKPENVLVESDGAQITKIVVTDFGIAMAAVLAEAVHEVQQQGTKKDVRLTAPGVVIGTPAYMAPEQLAAGHVDRRADVFAFSVSLWEALFGARPFLGNTVEQIRKAMRVKPKAPRVSVPSRLVRALERGLAIDPDNRWPDMRSLLRELAAVRSTRRRTIVIASAAGAALVGAGIAGALILTRSEAIDPCAKGLEGIVHSEAVARDVHKGLDATGKQRLSDTLAAWRTTHAATCKPDREPVQAPTVVACLDARELEIAAFLDDAKRDGVKASRMTRVMLDPARCKDPRQGLLFARVPAEPAERRAVSELRYRAFEIEAARDRSEFSTALPAAAKLVEDGKQAWPPVQAELLYLLGTTQALGGENEVAIETLRHAAALGERTHHAYIAANSWIQLIQTAALDAEDPDRALEYAAYADAALDGIGRPPDLEVLFLYFKGTSMVEADQAKEAEALLHRAIEIAEKSAPQYLARATLGLGYLYEDQGRYTDAVAAYRRAIRQLASSTTTTSAHTFRERLAINLALLGESAEAEKLAREAVAIAEQTLPEGNVDRAIVHTTLGQVLHTIGKSEPGLAEVRLGAKMFVKVMGERNERYGEILALEGNILVETEQYAEAAKVLARACEIVASGFNTFTSQYAECLLSHAIALDGIGKTKAALVLADEALDTLELIDGDTHPRVASAHVQRGALRVVAGRQADAIVDFEVAIAAFEKLTLEPGHLAGAKWALGRTLWKSQRARAKQLVEEAVA
ncbi:MAG: serine/threonine protein kinase, partial [Deltaproteobacteria bacterium]|nr:serine/threonine protein kinase [Deltaproteobacteria bacterium]